jgi:hypothetical protein
MYLQDDPNFMEAYSRSHTYVARSNFPPKVLAKLGSATALRQLLNNDGLKPARKQHKQQDTSTRKQQDPSTRKQQGPMDISKRPKSRPQYREQDTSTRKKSKPMDISNRPTRQGANIQQKQSAES